MFLNNIRWENILLRLSLLLKILLLCLGLFGCGGIEDDLLPSDSDKRPTVEAGVEGSAVSQLMPDFSLTTTEGNILTRDSLLAAGEPLVFYFTQWCAVCDTHQSHYINQIAPAFPGVNYILVDIVSGSIAFSRDAQISAGYRASTVLVDDGSLENALQASMGTTVVVDLNGEIKMNEDYKNGSLLGRVLKEITQ